MRKDIRLIILNYKRPDNVFYLINKFKDKMPILIVNNNPDFYFPKTEGAEILNNHRNMYCIERWYYATYSNYKYSIILDDDIDPSFDCIIKMYQELENNPNRLYTIYGLDKIEKANKYENLETYWCVNKEVQIAVGACIGVSTNLLYSTCLNLNYKLDQKRGDDILVSLTTTSHTGQLHKVIETQVKLLPEGDCGLNRDPNHYEQRWHVIQNFNSPFTALKN
jgi:hypothetical protein